MSAGLN